MPTVLDLAFSWFGLSTLVGALALLVAILLPAPLLTLMPGLRHVALSIAVYAFGFSFVYGLGYGAARNASKEDALQAQIERLQFDLKVRDAQAERSEEHAREIKAAEADNGKKVEQINVVLQARPKGERCNLSADDARRLRDIR